MEEITKVEIIDCDIKSLHIWLRRNMDIGLHEAYELSKNGSMINFYGNYKKAIELFDYLESLRQNSARLIINVSFDTRGFTPVNCFE